MATVRELDQLSQVAKHYLRQAIRSSRRHPSVLSKTLGNVVNQHVEGKLLPEELILAHLASCAIRLSTICEKETGKFDSSYRTHFYKNMSRKPTLTKQKITAAITQNLDQHIHFLLRDHVGHKENVKSEMASDRLDVLLPLTIREVLDALDACEKKIRTVIRT